MKTSSSKVAFAATIALAVIINAFVGCVNMPNYEVIHANWK